MTHLLQVSELRYSYGTRKAIEGVSFDVRHGELLGLLGANGAGKTTTISCIAGLLTDWQGELTLNGKPFRPAQRWSDRALIGIVPQDLAIYDGLSGRENLKLFAKLSGVPKAQVADQVSKMIEFAGLESRQNDYVKTYSGGMKRRLNLVSGIVHQPKILLLDEPTVGVDPQSRNHLFESILSLKAMGISILYTTHYMEEAEKLCDRIAIMNEGKVVAVGTVAELAFQIGNPDATLEQIFLRLTGRQLRDEAS